MFAQQHGWWLLQNFVLFEFCANNSKVQSTVMSENWNQIQELMVHVQVQNGKLENGNHSKTSNWKPCTECCNLIRYSSCRWTEYFAIYVQLCAVTIHLLMWRNERYWLGGVHCCQRRHWTLHKKNPIYRFTWVRGEHAKTVHSCT